MSTKNLTSWIIALSCALAAVAGCGDREEPLGVVELRQADQTHRFEVFGDDPAIVAAVAGMLGAAEVADAPGVAAGGKAAPTSVRVSTGAEVLLDADLAARPWQIQDALLSGTFTTPASSTSALILFPDDPAVGEVTCLQCECKRYRADGLCAEFRCHKITCT